MNSFLACYNRSVWKSCQPTRCLFPVRFASPSIETAVGHNRILHWKEEMRYLTYASSHDIPAFAVSQPPKLQGFYRRPEPAVVKAIFRMSAAPKVGEALAPLRILCLHGFMQNAVILRRKTGALRKALSRGDTNTLAHFYYLDAPFILNKTTPPSDQNSEPSTKRDAFEITYSPGRLISPEHSIALDARDRPQIVNRAWWHAQEPGYIYDGWDQSLNLLLSTISELVSFARVTWPT